MTLESLALGIAARWPGLHVEPTELAAALSLRGLEPSSSVAMDVALVCALAARDRRALDIFEREIVSDIRSALFRLDRTGDLVEDALQQVREKLFVARQVPRISEYRGRGALLAWIQVIAIRELLMLQRKVSRARPPLDQLLGAVETDPVLALAKRRHRAEFADAFRDALVALATRDRTLLRLCFVDAVGTEQLAHLYGVHRVTMFRWLCDARAHLLDGIRASLIAKTGIDADEVDSLIRALASSLEIGW